MPKQFPVATQTTFAELIDQALDAQFDEDFDERGTFISKRVKGADYWYFQRWTDGKARQTYVGPARDPDITSRVERFSKGIKPSFDQRRTLVRTLIAAGLPRPDPQTGLLIEALWKAGFFRLRGVLIGTTAFQCYAGLLGVKLSFQSLRTSDADLAQYLAIPKEVNDTMPPMDEVLRSVDDTFRPVLDSMDGRHVIEFKSRTNYRVEFLTPHRGSGRHLGKPVRMPALGGVSAVPLTYLDFLLRDPDRSVLLENAGVPVLIPSPQRYAIHKLIVATQRLTQSSTKANKDLVQAATLFEAMQGSRLAVLISEAWIEAWDRGPKWRTALRAGRDAMSGRGIEALTESIKTGFAFLGEGMRQTPKVTDYGF